MQVELKSAIRVIDKKIEALTQKIAALNETRRILLDFKADAVAEPTQPVRQRRKLSKEALKRISAAQKKRWANFRATHPKAAGASA